MCLLIFLHVDHGCILVLASTVHSLSSPTERKHERQSFHPFPGPDTFPSLYQKCCNGKDKSKWFKVSFSYSDMTEKVIYKYMKKQLTINLPKDIKNKKMQKLGAHVQNMCLRVAESL